MATVLGSLRPDATSGEKTVLDVLHGLPDDVLVWPELTVGDSYPDFVILHPRRGILVLEVKDWVQIARADLDTITVVTRSDDLREEPHPAKAVRSKAYNVINKLESSPLLLHSDGPHANRLKFPWQIAVAFPNLTRLFTYQLGPVFEDCPIFCQDDLQQMEPERVLDLVRWRFPASLTAQEMDAARAVLWPQVVIRRGDEIVGTADIFQERVAREGVFETQSYAPDDELPEPGRKLAVNPAVRLVRGVVGSGKTLVLAMRAKFLAEAHPDWRILVVTFNRPLADDLQHHFQGYNDRIEVTNFHRLCRQLLEQIDAWSSGPTSDRKGRLANILNHVYDEPRLDAAFLDEEVAWIKDMGITSREAYLNEPRVGRGTPLNRSDREFAWEVYQTYQERMRRMWRQYDWSDVPLMVSEAMQAGYLNPPRYDAILVDEAQDFAPVWFDVLRAQLNPETAAMFLSADGVQRIYRKHSWKSLGFNVVGRTRILNRSYRSTYEIARAARFLLHSDETVRKALADEGEDLPPDNLDPEWMRHDEPPQLFWFPNQTKERQWLVNRIKQLRQDGYRLNEIAVFSYTHEALSQYARALRNAGIAWHDLRGDGSNGHNSNAGVTLGTMHAAKGLEFRVVIAGQIQDLFSSGAMPTTADAMRRDQAEKIRLLYVAITRARDRLYLTYYDQLPAALKSFQTYCRNN